MRSEDALGHTIVHTEVRHRGLDIFVNNAGIRHLTSALETTREVWDEVMAVYF